MSVKLLAQCLVPSKWFIKSCYCLHHWYWHCPYGNVFVPGPIFISRMSTLGSAQIQSAAARMMGSHVHFLSDRTMDLVGSELCFFLNTWSGHSSPGKLLTIGGPHFPFYKGANTCPACLLREVMKVHTVFSVKEKRMRQSVGRRVEMRNTPVWAQLLLSSRRAHDPHFSSLTKLWTNCAVRQNCKAAWKPRCHL